MTHDLHLDGLKYNVVSPLNSSQLLGIILIGHTLGRCSFLLTLRLF